MDKLNTKEAAQYATETYAPTARGTLEVWRSLGKGPRYDRYGRRVFYRKCYIDEYYNALLQTVETVDSMAARQ